jgi:hypothetical protein
LIKRLQAVNKAVTDKVEEMIAERSVTSLKNELNKDRDYLNDISYPHYDDKPANINIHLLFLLILNPDPRIKYSFQSF